MKKIKNFSKRNQAIVLAILFSFVTLFAWHFYSTSEHGTHHMKTAEGAKSIFMTKPMARAEIAPVPQKVAMTSKKKLGVKVAGVHMKHKRTMAGLPGVSTDN
jgi:predicted negative regulator of RcsB-dependent stress response